MFAADVAGQRVVMRARDIQQRRAVFPVLKEYAVDVLSVVAKRKTKRLE